jgi:hypothetical protein
MSEIKVLDLHSPGRVLEELAAHLKEKPPFEEPEYSVYMPPCQEWDQTVAAEKVAEFFPEIRTDRAYRRIQKKNR